MARKILSCLKLVWPRSVSNQQVCNSVHDEKNKFISFVKTIILHSRVWILEFYVCVVINPGFWNFMKNYLGV